MKDDLLKEVEAELAGQPDARKKLDRYRSIAESLGSPEPELEAIDFAAAVRQNAAPRPARSYRLWWSSGLAAAAALVLFVALRPPQFRAKGGSTTSWAGVRLFREGPPPSEVATSIGAHEGVLVSYQNLGPKPYSYLMVYAVDARGAIWWLHPAWQNAADDPAGIPLQAGRAELRSLIHPQWSPGPVTVHALFTRQPLHVRAVEAGSRPEDFSEQIVTFTVQP